MSQHVQDPAIIERRLRPIYDNLEVGNNRKALQEAEKLLKKNPNVLCIKALKGLAQLRLGRFEESHSLLKMVTEEHPTDDATLQVLSFCYKELEQLDKIVDIYNYAVKQQPNNEELLAHLFISYVRLEDFKSQQTVALQLYKAHPKNAYYFWAVMSVLLQGVRGPESKNPTKRDIFLSLAQRMVDKMIQEDKLESEQEVHIYLQILRLQNKFKDALDFLNGSICNKLYPAAPIYMKITLFKELKMWKECNILLKTLLSEDPDRWDYHQDYLTSCFELLNADKHCDLSNHDDLSNQFEKCKINLIELDECHEFLCQLIETAKKKVRGPYLARLELYKRLKLKKLEARPLLGDFNELIVEYFHLFGDKSCCTHDIALFLPIIPLEDRQKLSSRLLIESGISCLQLPQTKEQMLKHICALQISRICGSHLDCHIDHLLALYTALKLHYEHGLSSFGKNLLITDMGPSDPYALLAANVMYDISQQQQKSDHVFEALCLLQYNLRNSSSNFHVKLFCLKIYHMLGCTFGAHEMYEYLDMKQIQLDSMGYIHCNPLSLSGRFSMARAVYDSTLKFYTSSYKERLDYLALTYRFGTFSKIEEFMNFKERLTHSLHYMATCVEVQLCDLVTLNGTVQQNLSTYTMMGIEPGEDHICWHKLTDNRDLAALVRWDPIHLVEQETERKDSQQQEIEILRIRSLLLRLIAAFVELFHPDIVCKHNAKSPATSCSGCVAQDANHTCNAKARQPEGVAIIESLMDAWRALFQRLRANELKPLPNRFLVNLLPTRLHLLLELPVENFYYDLAQLVLQLNAGFNDLPMQCKTMSDNVVKVVEICKATIKESNATVDDNLWGRRKWQNTVAVCIEMLSLYSFTLSVIYEKLYAVGKVSKSKKRSTENALLITEKERCQLLIELLKHLKLQLQCCDRHIESWKSPILPRDLNSFMADMSLKPEVEANLIGDVALVFKESHERMISELREILKDKMRMITK